LKCRGRYSEVSDYENLVVKVTPDGKVLHLKDVARIEIGTVNYDLRSTTEGKPGASASITQVAGSNANDIIKQIDQVENQARKALPPGMMLADQTSVMDFLNASIYNVVETLIIALILVIIVVGLFLRDWRSMAIPAIAIIVSLIGTFISCGLLLLTQFAHAFCPGAGHRHCGRRLHSRG
jgi:multidrug efflux pump subunit AcrB